MISVYEGLRSYQICDVLRAEDAARAFYYEPRLGKSRTSVRTLLRWCNEFGLKRHLIVGPLTPLQITWMSELQDAGFAQMPTEDAVVGFVVPLLKATTKIKWAGDILRSLGHSTLPGNPPIVVLINDDVLSAQYSKTKTIADLIVEWEPETLIRDEAHRDATAGSGRSRALRRIARYTKHRRSLTGTPDPNGLQSIYSQMAILEPTLFGTSQAEFRRRYIDAADPYYRTIIGYRNEREFLEKIMSVASIVRAADHFDVPPMQEITRRITMPDAAREMYKAMVRTDLLNVPEMDIDLDGTHALTKLLRLQQLAQGFLPVASPETTGAVGWLHDAKIDSVVADCVEPMQAGEKIVVSHLWRPEGERVAEALRKKFGKLVVVELNGRTREDRAALIRPFDMNQDGAGDARILVVQEATGGEGISYARAKHLHFLSWSYSWDKNEQMSKRLWHESQRFWTRTYHEMSGTVDLTVRATVRRKSSATIMLRENSLEALAMGVE